MGSWYVVEPGGVIRKASMLEASEWFESCSAVPFMTGGRQADRDTVAGSVVSTVFLGLDHGHNAVPILFETLVFGGQLDGNGERYSTYDEAVAGHAKWVNKAKESAQ